MGSPVTTPPVVPEGTPSTPPAAPFPAKDLRPATPPASPPASPSAEVATLMEEVKAVKTALNGVMEENKALKTQVANFQSGIRTLGGDPPATPTTDPNVEFWKDPNKATNELIRNTVGPLINSYITDKGASMKDRFRNTYPEIFKRWGEEIDTMTKDLNPAYLAAESTWEVVIERLKGRHLKEFMSDPSLTSGATAGSSLNIGGEPTPQDPVKSLTERELKLAKSMGVTPEKYAAQKAKMEVWK